MRLIKMSKDKFELLNNQDAVIKYFQQVLPWGDYTYSFLGKQTVAQENIRPNETIIISYDMNIVAIAKLKETVLDDSGKVFALRLKPETLKVFPEPASIEGFQEQVREAGYNITMDKQAWPIIPDDCEPILIEYLQEHEWNAYLPS